MANFNKCYFVGRFTADPIKNSMTDGRDIATFSLAIERKVDKDTTATTFLDFKAFGSTATAICNYCTRGREILIESHAEQQAWQDKQTGKTRTRTAFIVESFQFIGNKPRTARDTQPSPTADTHQQAKQNAYQPQQPAWSPQETPDDCPF
jgi:single-strand DNA-binding protein